uniref:Uncharacterized protein n=1 Tax=Anguilla anguilla TaxID=7936 RepID=A0A0E9W0B3_ANGAN
MRVSFGPLNVGVKGK